MHNALPYLSFTSLIRLVDTAVRSVWCVRDDGKYPVHTIIAFAQLCLCEGFAVTERTAAGGLMMQSQVVFCFLLMNGTAELIDFLGG
jgi:hypothetical protein